MPKKKQVFEPENLESIQSAISGMIVERQETIEPVVYTVDLLSRHDPYYPMVQGEPTSRLAMTAMTRRWISSRSPRSRRITFWCAGSI